MEEEAWKCNQDVSMTVAKRVRRVDVNATRPGRGRERWIRCGYRSCEDLNGRVVSGQRGGSGALRRPQAEGDASERTRLGEAKERTRWASGPDRAPRRRDAQSRGDAGCLI